MRDDRLSWESDREIFEAIVSELDDPELVELRRMFLVLSAALYLTGVIVIAVVGGLGWPGAAGFSSTFVPALVLARRFKLARFGRPAVRRAREAA